ncbi:phospho-N-acetylmuramoyl-pentapeptide-transferase [Streptococcus constellatus]|uniref:Phospho-N-acetylmuramoyl-pentapeptide-transferase n=1 Tax=Streptococcus constellatus subsp. constellatus SK53 TaxID=1095730 RepID=A0AAD2SWJ1_STRCV|nr:phospho-N-acetylmuramoyl-pentapeptide-transferase [Streptococcus constellatus]EID20153.1 phospho-N-acetylmuramoyl-pentapeptide-transferase [Streptococcus constellatus subsp. constellatus SK53]MDP1486088.1 phospho-N-acetylmuramoyl-pentapeptide-transferase [Streptococcus constellatus]QQT05457.1 phospho-N-acetylmuramoyl-pentapeptide-transferase [Streptococcus constellatus]SUN39982.1 phospho-N-acetylmuramoyl-pentapeptide-transferase [Streptococcus constellatus]BBD22041.1 phospho-N-acetylmuramoy
MLQAIIAGIVTFILTLVGIPAFIRFYHKAHISGQQMHEDVKQHQAKAGTPTMGGTVFLVASVLSSFVTALISKELSSAALMVLFILVLYGIVGFLDDFLKVFRKINEGLNPKQKLALQIIGGIVFYFFFDTHGGGDLLNVFGFPLHLGYLYIAFTLFWLVGFSNAVNLTDGIDGLASISVTISLVAYAVIATVQHRLDILIVILSMIGGLLAFFIFNHKPAKIFMGDVGSLALGGMLAAISIALHQEWTLLIIGIVYVFETTSVMMQVSYFKLTGGKRIFRMTPVHHHFELGGLSGHGQAWSEWKVDFFFWGIGLIASLLTLAILYL